MERHARHLEEKDQHGLVSYHALDAEDTQGEETSPSPDAASVEDEAIAPSSGTGSTPAQILLPSQEWELIQALYFEELSERDLARKTGVPQRTIHDRKKKAIAHLKKC